MITNLATCIDKDLTDAIGKPGVSGNAIKMLNTVDAIFHNCRRFLDFERALSAAEVPSAFIN